MFNTKTLITATAIAVASCQPAMASGVCSGADIGKGVMIGSAIGVAAGVAASARHVLTLAKGVDKVPSHIVPGMLTVDGIVFGIAGGAIGGYTACAKAYFIDNNDLKWSDLGELFRRESIEVTSNGHTANY
jgi:hypothetical protein